VFHVKFLFEFTTGRAVNFIPPGPRRGLYEP